MTKLRLETKNDTNLTYGQTTKAGSLPVAIASDQGALSVQLAAGSSTVGNVVVAGMPAVASGVKLSPTGGSKTVAAAGTAEALVGTSTKRTMLLIRAKTGNTGNVYVGDSGVDKTSSQQVVLAAGQSISIAAPGGYYLDVNEWYVDADTNGEGVDFLYV